MVPIGISLTETIAQFFLTENKRSYYSLDWSNLSNDNNVFEGCFPLSLFFFNKPNSNSFFYIKYKENIYRVTLKMVVLLEYGQPYSVVEQT